MIQICTRLSGAWIAASPLAFWFAVASRTMPNQSRSAQTRLAHPRRVLADAAGEHDGVGPAQQQQIGAEVVPHRRDENVQGQLRAAASPRAAAASMSRRSL